MREIIVKEYHNEQGLITRREIGQELVRCKDCKHCKRKKGTFRGEPIFFYRCEEHNRDVESDDFCAWGEREVE